jgi:diamine N-acetyltransferase
MSAGPLEFHNLPVLPQDQAEAIARTLAGMDPWRTLGYAPEVLARSLAAPHPDLTRCLAVRDGEALGLAVLRYPWLRGAYIEIFAVLPGAQGQGVGAALLDRIEGAYRGRTANLWLLVSGFNAPARGFYARHGFREIGPIPDLVMPGQVEVLMRKVL